MTHPETYIAKTMKGLEQPLAEELTSLGAGNVRVLNRGVSFQGGKAMLYKVNLASRLALRVLVPLTGFEVTGEEGLYRGVKRFDWGLHLDNKMTFAIDPVVHSPHFKNSHYVALKVKDAIVDRFRERTHLRPSVSKDRPDLLVNVHVSGNRATISLDSSGGSLHKRGYRIAQTGAPLNEVLAAGMIMLSGWNGDSPFLDPMCGSGTLVIEAAMIASGIPPGFFRKHYGFERWKSFDPELLETVARALGPERDIQVPILARDIDPQAVEATRRHLSKTGLDSHVRLEIMDFSNSEEMEGMTIITNPPYGERLQPGNTGALYSMIGSTLKHRFPESDAWILSSSQKALKQVGLKPASRHILYNGGLECTYVNYKTFRGDWKGYKAALKC